MDRGFIKIYREFENWEWRDQPNMVSLFLYLLLKANYKNGSYQGHKIPPGSLVSGRFEMSRSLGLSEQQVRTCLKKLEKGQKITIKTTNKFSIISVTNWKKYQDDNQQVTNKQPTSNQQVTTSKEGKKERKKEYRPEKISDEIWEDFVLLRKRKKAPITKTAIDGIEREAKKINWSLERALQEMCQRGWQGFNSGWVDSGGSDVQCYI